MAYSWQRQHLMSGIAGDARFISANTAEWRSPALVAISAFLTKTQKRGNLPDCRDSLIIAGPVWLEPEKRHFSCHDISFSTTWRGEDSERAGLSVLSLRVWVMAPQPERISAASSCLWAITVIYSPSLCLAQTVPSHARSTILYPFYLCTRDLTGSVVCFVSSYQKVLCGLEMWGRVWCIQAVQIKGLEKGAAVRLSNVA